MRFTEQYPDERDPRLNLTDQRIGRAQDFLNGEIEDAYSARQAEEKSWEESLRQYHARPKEAVKDIPVENAPNVEVPLVGTACDALYAMVLDLIFSLRPTLTASSAAFDDEQLIEVAKCAQDFGNWGERNEWRLRDAMEHACLDVIQLGTGVLFIPHLVYRRQTDIARMVDQGPRILSVPLEDFLMPSGSYNDVQEMPWVAHRQWFTEGELRSRAKYLGWDIEGIEPITTVGWVRSRRESFGRVQTNLRLNTPLYEIHTVYPYFDIDNDGYDEDLCLIFDRRSRKILKASYNGYDCRPYEVGRYQLLAHLPYGLGAGEMLRSMQDEASTLHNAKTLNVLMANARMWLNQAGSGIDEPMLKAYFNRVITVNNMEAFKELQMSTAHTPAVALHEASILQFAERRVGTGELSNPRPSNLLSSRTPGITALTAMQTVNRRFTAAFDQMRLMGSRAVQQCFMRYRERLLVNDRQSRQTIEKVVGKDRANPLIDALKSPDFLQNVLIEFTASSALVNQAQERQDAVQLYQILQGYYSGIMNMMTVAASPQAPPEIKDVAAKIVKAGGEAVERTIRTFDKVRDPRAFIIDLENNVDQAVGPVSPDLMAQLASILGLGTQQALSPPAYGTAQ